MLANILIATGFFFTGFFIGAFITVGAYQKALNEWKKENEKETLDCVCLLKVK